jgi:hypothetical protein
MIRDFLRSEWFAFGGAAICWALASWLSWTHGANLPQGLTMGNLAALCWIMLARFVI